MSTSTIGVWKLWDAQEIARVIIEQLQPYCHRIFVAGSIRRKEPYINDIEIVCQPKKIDQQVPVNDYVKQSDLFGEVDTVKLKKMQTIKVRMPEFVKLVESWEKVKGDAAEGRYTQRIIAPHNIKLDLFMPQEHDFFRQLAIRTGSAVFVREFVSLGWRKRGWVGTKDGLRLQVECKQDLNDQWICQVPNPTLPPAWQSEEGFFSWLGHRYPTPESRCYG